MGRDIWSCSHWRILLGRHASSSPWLPFILRLTLLILLSVLVCRSSSPSCSGVSGFHESQRLRHSQLVSTTSRPVPRTNHVSLCLSFFFLFFFYVCFVFGRTWGTAPSIALAAYHSKRVLSSPFQIVYLPFCPEGFLSLRLSHRSVFSYNFIL